MEAIDDAQPGKDGPQLHLYFKPPEESERLIAFQHTFGSAGSRTSIASLGSR